MARALISVTGAQTDTELVPAVAGKSIFVLGVNFTVSADATVSLSDGADGATTRLLYGDYAANSGVFAGGDSGAGGEGKPLAILTVATALKITNSAGNLKGVVTYRYNSV
jgi:hypothetical protein